MPKDGWISIANTENEIVKSEKEIKENEEKIKQKKEETNQMLLYLQLSNGQGDSMLEYVFEADNITEIFLSRENDEYFISLKNVNNVNHFLESIYFS